MDKSVKGDLSVCCRSHVNAVTQNLNKNILNRYNEKTCPSSLESYWVYIGSFAPTRRGRETSPFWESIAESLGENTASFFMPHANQGLFGKDTQTLDSPAWKVIYSYMLVTFPSEATDGRAGQSTLRCVLDLNLDVSSSISASIVRSSLLRITMHKSSSETDATHKSGISSTSPKPNQTACATVSEIECAASFKAYATVT
ncbi:hypothetical protein AVEN_168584-1 [Araneus ventricosus]|uniref:Uncharacterized protein n=1 Tax=Araneus ventricosus TaxID=182803 RepID=A0A4Y2KGT0_ARAVE|nr:hypothetical protein AVEN_168584-1 [Araneus ventricosus]